MVIKAAKSFVIAFYQGMQWNLSLLKPKNRIDPQLQCISIHLYSQKPTKFVLIIRCSNFEFALCELF